MPITQDSLRETALDVLPHQWLHSTALRAVITDMADMVWEELGEPLMEYENWPNPEKMTGQRLDHLGNCIGISRPFTTTGTYFAFEGAPGETFTQAPFFSAESALQNRNPISDANYRPFLRWRLANLGGSPTYGDLQESVFNTADGFYGFENGSISVSGSTITISSGTVTGVSATLWDFLSGSQEALSRAMLPRVAGKTYSFS